MSDDSPRLLTILDGSRGAPSTLWAAIWCRLGAIPVWQKLAGLIVLPLVAVVAVTWLVASETGGGGTDKSAQGQIVLVLLTGGVLGLALSFGLGFALTRPLYSLIETMKRIQAGDLSARVRPWADDEIGEVQRTFNSFVEALDRSQSEVLAHNKELASLNGLSALVSRGRDVEQVVGSALPRVAQMLDADCATLCLPSEGFVTYYSASRDSAELAVVTGRDPDSPGLLDHIMNSGRPTLIRDVSVGDLHPGIPPIACSLWASTPLRVHDLAIGALGIGVHHEGDHLSNGEALLDAVGHVVGMGVFNARLLADLEQREDELRSALRSAVLVQEEERRSLSRELHDGTGQALTSMLLNLKSIENESDIEVIQDRIAGMRYIAASTLEEVRRLSRDLRPAIVDDLGLIPALEWLTRRHETSGGCGVELSVSNVPPTMSKAIEIAVFRIVQEALTNIARHAEATKANVSIETQDGRIVLTISDDGVGMDTAEVRRGLGLVGIRERVGMLGGLSSLTSSLGTGTRLVAEIPLTEA